MTIRESTVEFILGHFQKESIAELAFGDFKDALRNVAECVDAFAQGTAERLLNYWSHRGAVQFNALRDSIPRPPTEEEVDNVENSQLASLEKADRVVQAKDTIFWQQLTKAISSLSNRKTYAVQLPQKKLPVTRVNTLMLSDLHFGANLDGDELPLEYGIPQESRRFAKVILEACQFKRQYRAESSLNLLLGGDMFQGQLHDLRDGAPLAEQIARTIFYIEQAVRVLASEYPEVRVYCATGNHGRNQNRHKKLATNQKHDSLETVIYYAVKQATADCKNVFWFIPKTPYVEFDMCGATGFMTHGDTVLRPGNPGKSINVKAVESKINQINAARPGKEYSVFVMGHVHVGSVVRLQGNKRVMVTNGCLIPPDGFATSLGIFEGNCGQFIWESVAGHPFGDSRFLEVDAVTDADESLNQVIKPWKGYNG